MKKKIKIQPIQIREILFNSDQQVIILKMFKLFFDNIESEDNFEGRVAPIANEFEDYNLISPDYNLINLYKPENLDKLFPEGEISMDEMISQFPSDSTN